MYGDDESFESDIVIEPVITVPSLVNPIDPTKKMPPLPDHSSGIGITYGTQRQPHVTNTNIIRIYGLGELSTYDREIYVPKNLPWLQYGEYIRTELGLKDIPIVIDDEGYDIETREYAFGNLEVPRLIYIIKRP
jgi:hypothetical protein